MQSDSFSLPTKRCILQDMGTLPHFLWQLAERSHGYGERVIAPLQELQDGTQTEIVKKMI